MTSEEFRTSLAKKNSLSTNSLNGDPTKKEKIFVPQVMILESNNYNSTTNINKIHFGQIQTYSFDTVKTSFNHCWDFNFWINVVSLFEKWLLKLKLLVIVMVIFVRTKDHDIDVFGHRDNLQPSFIEFWCT